MKKNASLLICLFLVLINTIQSSAQKNIGCKLINSFPYYESFESDIGWNQVTDDDGNWTRGNNGTPSQNTGPRDGADGSYYIFLEASTTNSVGQIGTNATAIIESNYFDFSKQTKINFSFSNHMYGNSVGSLILQACINNSEWSTIWSLSGNRGNQWNKVEISLNEYLGKGFVKLRFIGITGDRWSSDIAIDAISINSEDSN